MAEIQQSIFLITPIPYLRVLKRESWKMHADDEYLIKYGQKQHDADIAAGKENPIRVNHHLNRKKSMEKRLDYKEALQWEAKRNKFTMPTSQFWIKYYLPMPASWSKKKRNEMAFQPHTVMPDVENLTKLFVDCLVKRDQIISDFRASKFWFDGSKGFIAVTVGELSPPVGHMITQWERNNLI